jgi:hypothetical protein
MSAPDVTVRCVPGADLTAYAHGELPDVRRAEVSRHLLRCATCRAEADETRALFGRLRDFGAEGEDWRAEIAAAGAPAAAGRRTRRRAALAGLASAAAAALALAVGFPRGAEPPPAAREAGLSEVVAMYPEIGGTLLPEDESALLQAQQLDGRWAAGGGARDEAATSLAVAALAGRYGRGLADDTVGQAVRAGVEWLLARRALPSVGLPADGAPDAARDGSESTAAQALATAAVLEVYAATGDRALRPALDRALRSLQLARRADLSGDSTLGWAHRALSRAQELGWDGLGPSLRRFEDWMGGHTRVASLAAVEDPSEMIAIAMRMIASSSRG